MHRLRDRFRFHLKLIEKKEENELPTLVQAVCVSVRENLAVSTFSLSYDIDGLCYFAGGYSK